MKRCFKIFNTLIILLICASLLSCQKNNSSPLSPFQKDANLNEVGVFPVCKEKITLTIGIENGGKLIEDYKSNALTKYLEEKMNANLEFMFFDEGEADKSIKLMMSAGGKNLPDIVIGDNVDDFDVIAYAQKGLIIPLNNYYENSSYYLKKIIDKEKGFLDLITMSDGNIYTIPRYTKILQNEFGVKLWIYKPFLDRLGLDMPKTTDEFYEVLEKIKNGDPNENGTRDEIPFIGTGAGNANGYLFADFIMSAFVYADAEDYYMYPENGEIKFACTDIRWKEGLKYLNKLCAQNLLSPASFITTADQFKSIIDKKDVIAGSFISMGPYFSDENKSRYSEYKVVEPLIGPGGEQNPICWATKPRSRFFITKNCKYPEAAFRLGDIMCDEEVAIMNRWGVEGKDWEKAGENDTGVASDEGYPALIVPKLEWGVRQNSHWQGKGPGYRDYNIGLGVAVTESNPMDYEIARSSLAYKKLMPEEYIVKLVYDAGEYDEVARISGEIMSYVNSATVDFVTGAKDIDVNWDKFVSDLNSLGAERLKEIMQNAYDRTLLK